MKKLTALLFILTFIFPISAGLVLAAVDKGKDGVDQDCRDFKWQQLAQRYFIADGGSKKRNVDDLDRDHDGVACETSPKAKSTPSVDPGRDGIDKGCTNFKWQQDAQSYFNSDDGTKTRNVDNLDGDHDGKACESLPRR